MNATVPLPDLANASTLKQRENAAMVALCFELIEQGLITDCDLRECNTRSPGIKILCLALELAHAHADTQTERKTR